MEQAKIQRINELAQKARSPEGLTPEEEVERALLRQEYVDAVLGNLQSQLDRTYVVDEQGNEHKLRKKDEV